MLYKLNKMNMESLNVFGKKIELCSTNPMTGFYRNGCCETGPNDYGTHTVCAIVTDEFLRFSKKRGNDLSTENPLYNFKGLKTVSYTHLTLPTKRIV